MNTESFESLSGPVAALFERADSKGIDSLTTSERVVFVVWSAVGQIENGGFDQFFYNSSGDFAAEAAPAFRTIGATGKAAVIDRALQLFPNGIPPEDRNQRIRLLDQATAEKGDEVFDELEQAFFAVPEDIYLLLARYVDSQLT